MHAIVNIALRVAREVATEIAQHSDRLDRVKTLPSPAGQLLTSVDVDIDNSLLYHLQKTYPEHGFLSRVSGSTAGKAGEPVWLIDPLVGNRNFINGYPQFAVSLACMINDKVEHAILLNPITRDEFSASRGKGAQVNARRMRVSSRVDLESALIGLDSDSLPTDSARKLYAGMLEIGALPRSSGCAALDMLAVASGQWQGGCCGPYQAISLAGAALILQEAGGFIGNESGNPDYKSATQLYFGNQKTFGSLVKLGNKPA